MQTHRAAVEQGLAHLRAVLDAKGLEGVVGGVRRLCALQEALGQARLAEVRHPLKAAKVVEAHDAGHDGHIDSILLACLHEVQEYLRVKEHLGDDELRSGVDLLLQVLHLLLEVGVAAHGHNLRAMLILGDTTAALLGLGEGSHATLDGLDVVRVPLWVASDRDREVIPVLLAHVLHKVQRTGEAALSGRPLLLTARRVTAERNNVAHANRLASVEGLPAHLALLVRAREVHVGDAAKFVLGRRGELEREL
mmetsp:Transcript_23502/g.65092  ORF Transcript_23502/g.65092 Transcript_23502/m.65092 type:complete len:251 (-) Transcript_23502:255-1007(-)